MVETGCASGSPATTKFGRRIQAPGPPEAQGGRPVRNAHNLRGAQVPRPSNSAPNLVQNSSTDADQVGTAANARGLCDAYHAFFWSIVA